MAFEPLQTDEKLEGPVKRERDMDTHMLIGCSGFVIGSVAVYALGVWPFFVFQKAFLGVVLAEALACAVVPQWIVGAIVTRRFGIAGACGFVGGSLCNGIFLFLRVSQLFVSARLQQSPSPEFPEAFAYLIPGVTVLACAFVAVLFLSKKELDDIDR